MKLQRPAAAGMCKILVQIHTFQICQGRRTCADDPDTDREIWQKIVCEELHDECAIFCQILLRGCPRGGIDPSGDAVRGCSPFCIVLRKSQHDERPAAAGMCKILAGGGAFHYLYFSRMARTSSGGRPRRTGAGSSSLGVSHKSSHQVCTSSQRPNLYPDRGCTPAL